MFFYDLTIKIPNFKCLRAKIPDSRGMGHCPKMVKISPVFVKFIYQGQSACIHSH